MPDRLSDEALRVASEIVGDIAPRDPQSSGFLLTRTELDSIIESLPVPGIVEIFGDASIGKTELGLRMIAGAQQQDVMPTLLDSEGDYDPARAAGLGVDLSNLIIGKTSCVEEILETIYEVVEDSRLVVVDSITAVPPLAAIESSLLDHNPGLFDRLMAHGLRKIRFRLNKYGATVVLINQIRHRTSSQIEDKTPYGNVISESADLRIELSNVGTTREGSFRTGRKVRARVTKSLATPPGREVFLKIGS